jgi:hypothetical protein
LFLRTAETADFLSIMKHLKGRESKTLVAENFYGLGISREDCEETLLAFVICCYIQETERGLQFKKKYQEILKPVQNGPVQVLKFNN